MTHVDENVQDSVMNLASAALDPFEEFATHCEHLPDDEFEESADTVDVGEDGQADSDSFYGCPIVGRTEHSIDLGGWSADFLNKEIAFMLAPKKEWGADSRWPFRGHLKGWLVTPITWGDFIETFANPGVSMDKNGEMFFLGELKASNDATGIARGKENVKRIYGMVFDIDSGQPEGEIFPPLLESGLGFIFYPSFSDGKTRDKVELAALKKFDANISNMPTITDVQRYLSHKGYHRSIIESVKLLRTVNTLDAFADKQSNEAPYVEIETAPITKARVILFLESPYIVPDDANERVESYKDWEAAYAHIGKQLGLQTRLDVPRCNRRKENEEAQAHGSGAAEAPTASGTLESPSRWALRRRHAWGGRCANKSRQYSLQRRCSARWSRP
jgi:hypothetical protein